MAASVSSGSRLPSLSKYEILEEIGHGGMATVYRAKDPRLGREVAVKVIHPHLRDSTEVAARFVTEAQAVAKLRHPNIVEVFDVSDEDDREQYLVVELLRGHTLRALLKERGPFPPEVAAALGIELLDALAHAHGEGIVHRDVKPENVLIEVGEGDGDSALKVKLADFGIAKLLDEKGVTSTGQVLGSPAHMAPEQIEGGAIDARSDVFGLGVLLYEAMVGHLPFEGNNPAQVLRRVLDGQYPSADIERPVVGKKFSLILDLSLAHLQDDRYPTARAMKDALAAELERLGVEDSRRELRNYLRSSETSVAAHEKRTVEKLVALGAAARKDQRAIDAAADYNRALAYAPTDPALMKIVGGMHKAEARARLLKRIAPLVAGTIIACLLAFGLAKWLRSPVIAGAEPLPTSSTSVGASTSASSPASALSVVPSASSSANVAATAPTIVRTATVATGGLDAATLLTTRTLSFLSVTPQSVTVVGDYGELHPIDDTTNTTLQIDSRAHHLKFQCAGNVCESAERDIAAGKDDVPIRIGLKFKAATLIVAGNPDRSYGIHEHSEIALRSGSPVSIPMNAGSDWVTVEDLNHPELSKKVKLNAGQQSEVDF
ncbi:hypothetical protein BH09MYX1_BH09MYX1_15490 [soil metagenome]